MSTKEQLRAIVKRKADAKALQKRREARLGVNYDKHRKK